MNNTFTTLKNQTDCTARWQAVESTDDRPLTRAQKLALGAFRPDNIDGSGNLYCDYRTASSLVAKGHFRVVRACTETRIFGVFGSTETHTDLNLVVVPTKLACGGK